MTLQKYLPLLLHFNSDKLQLLSLWPPVVPVALPAVNEVGNPMNALSCPAAAAVLARHTLKQKGSFSF